MLAVILFILILSILVLVHEFGHFLAAKKSGVRVEEFGFGLPPRILGKKIGETLYSINLLPFGGFVKLTGEDIDDPEELKNIANDPNNFNAKSPLRRLSILCAGVFMNILLAVFLYYIFFFISGFKSFSLPMLYDYNFKFGNVTTAPAVIVSIEPNSPAAQAELALGDSILEINGSPVYTSSDVRKLLKDRVGENTTVIIKNIRSLNPELRHVTVIPTADDVGDGIIGIYMGKTSTIAYESSTQKLLVGPMHTYNILGLSLHTFKNLIGTSLREKDFSTVSSGIAGPLGIFSIVSGILDYDGISMFTLLTLIDLVSMLSVGLAIINLFPFPALDGGRVVFILIEAITKRKISPRFETKVHQVGILILLTLMVLVSIRDISRIF